MVIVVVVILLWLIFGSKRRESNVADFLGLGWCGLVSGCIISISLGNWVVPGHFALTESNVLDSALLDCKERFILKERTNRGATIYTYFIRTKQGEVVAMGIAEEKIRYEQGEGVRVVKNFKKEFDNKKLNWLFFCTREYKEVFIFGEDDVFDDSHILPIDL